MGDSDYPAFARHSILWSVPRESDIKAFREWQVRVRKTDKNGLCVGWARWRHEVREISGPQNKEISDDGN
ncbi:MAG: hypothetical protein ABJF10_30345, partial [Chthoniobacter sp.]|uniref:hypothetical protein n=1 Tax=Chthoniobacter sp. TaxID=2510640 RepID=UPI0032A9B3B2